MFKKIELWILLLVVILSILVTLSFGVLVRQGIEGSTKLGNFSIQPLTDPIVSLVRIPEKLIRHLLKPNDAKIGDFWDTKRKYIKDVGFTGEKEVKPFYLLLSRYDGDIEQAVVELIDLRNFNVIYKWNPNINKFNELIDKKKKEFKNLIRDKNDKRFIISHPFLTEQGELLFANMSQLIKIDKCANLIWQNQDDIFHHSIEQDMAYNFWIPTITDPSKITNYEKFDANDTLTKINSEGKIIFSKTLIELFYENNLEFYLHGAGFNVGEPFHLNDIEPVKNEGYSWKVNDIFISIRNLSMIILYRPEENKIIDIIQGPFLNQHDVDIISDHEISIFNNNLKLYPNKTEAFNTEIIIYNFKTKKFKKYFNESLLEHDVITDYQGLHKILPDGQLFIESTTNGRILFFNSNGKLKWQFVNNDNKKTELYTMGWSRILHSSEDLAKVNFLLGSKCKI